MSEITVFKIRSKTTGMFSTGGHNPGWSKKGKMWNMRGHVSNHLSGLYRTGRETYRDNDAEVIECVIREENVDAIPVSEWLAAVEQYKADKETARKQAHADRERARRLAEYQKLQKEFG